MTGLYSERNGDDSSVDVPQEGGNESPEPAIPIFSQHSTQTNLSDAVVKCHSRQPSSSLIDNREKAAQQSCQQKEHQSEDDDLNRDCGILTCRPFIIQKFARIKIFVLLLSILVTLQQALSSGYINSVITTIEKRFEIPSSYSGLIASSYEIGNVITVIFVSYLGSRRHIPVWIGIGECLIIQWRRIKLFILLVWRRHCQTLSLHIPIIKTSQN